MGLAFFTAVAVSFCILSPNRLLVSYRITLDIYGDGIHKKTLYNKILWTLSGLFGL